MSSISSRSTRRSHSLKRERRLALHGGDEVVHEVVGGQVDDVAPRIGCARAAQAMALSRCDLPSPTLEWM
jgi:hypothetical protein